MDESSDLRAELKRDFHDFLSADFAVETGHGKYAKQMQDILKQYPTTKRVRLEVDLQGEICAYISENQFKFSACHLVPYTLFCCTPSLADLADFNEELHRRVINNPVDCLPAFEDALESLLRKSEEENAPKDALKVRSFTLYYHRTAHENFDCFRAFAT